MADTTDTNVITYYEVQHHLVGTTLWMGNWHDRSLDRADADANAQREREFADTVDYIDAVRVAEATVETVEPLVRVTVSASELPVDVYTLPERACVNEMANAGFVCVDCHHDRHGATLTFARKSGDEG